ncbi:MAG: hypothetical protein WA208_06060 [Thermoanaerobaculia bacterium]
MRRIVLLLLAAALAVPQAFAWGEKGHYIVSEAATLSLPTDMPHFFYRSFPDLIWLGVDPDRWRGGGDSLEAAGQNHFLDYEYVAGLELPESRYDFIALMESSGRLRRKGIRNDETGFLPWAIAEESQKLTVQFRLWRRSAAGSADRAIIERAIINTAGVLGHYVADGSNPHHTTYNYNGWVDPNPNGYAINCDTHSRFERDFVSHAVTVQDVVKKVAAQPVMRTDFFATALGHIKTSNGLVETLYRIDRDGGLSQLGPVNEEGFEFATSRLAAGATMLRDIWWSAWKESAKPPKRRGD